MFGRHCLTDWRCKRQTALIPTSLVSSAHQIPTTPQVLSKRTTTGARPAFLISNPSNAAQCHWISPDPTVRSTLRAHHSSGVAPALQASGQNQIPETLSMMRSDVRKPSPPQAHTSSCGSSAASIAELMSARMIHQSLSFTLMACPWAATFLQHPIPTHHRRFGPGRYVTTTAVRCSECRL